MTFSDIYVWVNENKEQWNGTDCQGGTKIKRKKKEKRPRSILDVDR
jgi:hypothetical protein